MLNALYSNINWSSIENVGFDMDGTLYDEFGFIKQVYGKICEGLNSEIEEFMLGRWFEKGSSYPHIYEEVYERFSSDLSTMSQKEFVAKSLTIFRNFEPKLELPQRTKAILGYMKKKYNLFLITDGNAKLQKTKFNALGLGDYFDENNVIFTNDLSKTKDTLDVTEVFEGLNPEKTLFFGDREIDEKFANKSNIKFILVYNMVKVK